MNFLTNEKVTVIFPMAGEASRFECEFKPFLTFDNKLFIENAVNSFLKYTNRIKEIIFIFLREQENSFDVQSVLENKFNTNFTIRTAILEKKTKSQYETVSLALTKLKIKNRQIIVCDCDHSLDVTKIFKEIDKRKSDCIIPVWKIGINEINSWSIVAISESKEPIEISEKKLPKSNGEFFGCIGCTYFSNSDYILEQEKSENISDVIMYLIDNPEKNVSHTIIDKAYFFGDPKRLKESENYLQNNYEHDDIKVIRKFKGGSFAKTVLIEKQDGSLAVRKNVKKDENLDLGYGRLKKQYVDLLRLSKICHDITPKLSKSKENKNEYFYDMEYLKDYKQLSEFTAPEKRFCIQKLLEVFNKDVYSAKAVLNEENNWLIYHLDTKIYDKLKKLSSNKKFNHIINSEYIKINDQKILGTRTVIDRIKKKHYSYFSPKFLSPIHGDLTFENIMFDGELVKIIDPDGGEYIDSPLLDFGKMLQSIISQYERWSNANFDLVDFNYENIKLNDVNIVKGDDGILEFCLNLWSDILDLQEDYDKVKTLGYFYMSLHLIRMVPFRMKASEDQAMYALVTATKYLNKCLHFIRDNK